MYDRLPITEKTLPWGQLQMKFFAEGHYSRAFDMWLEHSQVKPEAPDYEVIYTAGLGGRKEWLKNLSVVNRGSKDDMFKSFIRANLAWASGEYAKVLEETATPNGAATNNDRPPAANWLGLLSAKALARRGDYKSAYAMLADLLNRMRVDSAMRLHILATAAQVAEKAERYPEALAVTQMFLRLYPDELREKSFSQQAGALRALAERVKPNVSEAERLEIEHAIQRALKAREVGDR
ncbi:MAG: hypothetical protein NTX87_06340 [Planctomycetota bacterium]|nr:hypothetical protein [Planctomycetota bacterium]